MDVQDPCDRLRQLIAYAYDVPVDEVQQFLDTDSKAFLVAVYELSKQINRPWPTVKWALDQACRGNRHIRKADMFRDLSVVDDAKDLLQPKDLRSRGGLTLPLHTTKTETDSPSSQAETSTKAEVSRKVHVIMCLIPSGDIHQNRETFGITLEFNCNKEAGKVLERFQSDDDLKRYRENLGPSFVTPEGHKNPVIHQLVVAGLVAELTGRVSIEYHEWDWMLSHINNKTLAHHINSIDATEVIVLLPCQSSEWVDTPGLKKFYRRMGKISSSTSCRVYPSKAETLAQGGKVKDIMALDEIALKAPPEFSFRPETCFVQEPCGAACREGDDKMVVKRTFSNSAEHVIIKSRSDKKLWRLLDQGPQPIKTMRNCPVEPFYFHQQFVETFETYGELRVFMAGGEIVSIVKTKWEGGLLHSRVFYPDDDLSWVSKGTEKRQAKFEELKAFCRYINDKLIEMGGSSIFETVKAGVRLDIGISELTRHGRFFINEITRWTGAGFWNNAFCWPWQDFARKVGEAFAAEYGAEIDESDESRDESDTDVGESSEKEDHVAEKARPTGREYSTRTMDIGKKIKREGEDDDDEKEEEEEEEEEEWMDDTLKYSEYYAESNYDSDYQPSAVSNTDEQ